MWPQLTGVALTAENILLLNPLTNFKVKITTQKNLHPSLKKLLGSVASKLLIKLLDYVLIYKIHML